MPPRSSPAVLPPPPEAARAPLAGARRRPTARLRRLPCCAAGGGGRAAWPCGRKSRPKRWCREGRRASRPGCSVGAGQGGKRCELSRGPTGSAPRTCTVHRLRAASPWHSYLQPSRVHCCSQNGSAAATASKRAFDAKAKRTAALSPLAAAAAAAAEAARLSPADASAQPLSCSRTACTMVVGRSWRPGAVSWGSGAQQQVLLASPARGAASACSDITKWRGGATSGGVQGHEL